MSSAPAPRLAVSEVLLAAAGLVIGWAGLGLVTATGVLPRGEAGRALGLVYGPVAVGIGAFAYGTLATRVMSAPRPEVSAPLSLPKTALVVGLHVLAAIVGSEGLSWILQRVGLPVTEQEAVLSILRGGLEWGLPLIALGVGGLVLAPVAEEAFFRLLLFRRIRRTSGRVPAYVCSAAGFALIHQNPVGLVVYAWLGLVFASAFERTGRPGAAIGAHFGNNAIALSILLYQAHTGTLPPPPAP